MASFWTRIKGWVQIKPVGVWVSPLITVPSNASLTDVAFDAGDAIGGVAWVDVPKSGILVAARLYDRADLGTQLNIVLFNSRPISPPASDIAFALVDTDLPKVLYPLEFTVFKDYANGQCSFLENINLPYRVSEGRLHFQAYAPAAQTHVLGSEPQFQLLILPDEPV